MQDAIATVAELWRYPVKGMRGERVDSLWLDAHGIAGDRRWAVRSSGAPRGKPMLSGAERAAMLLFAARGEGDAVIVEAPDRASFGVGDRALLTHMGWLLPGGHRLELVRSATPMTDVRPVAVLGCETVRQLAAEMGGTVDARRFRANILLKFGADGGFAEDGLVGRSVRVGARAVLRITERDPRCRVVTLDPETSAADPALMKHLDRRHEGKVGVYATVTEVGEMCVGDAVVLI